MLKCLTHLGKEKKKSVIELKGMTVRYRILRKYGALRLRYKFSVNVPAYDKE
jgi:outer membrane phospholipase A